MCSDGGGLIGEGRCDGVRGLWVVGNGGGVGSVVEPFYFGPALASQDGGSCSGSSSSSSPVVHNLWPKKVFKNLTSQFTEACSIPRKVQVLCFALSVLYLKRQKNLI